MLSVHRIACLPLRQIRANILNQTEQNLQHVPVTRATLRLRDLDPPAGRLEKTGFLPCTLPTTHPAHQLARLVSNDEVLHRTGLFDVSYIVRKRRLGLFGHVARLRSDVPANLILRICTKTRDGERPSQEWRRAYGRPSTTWVHQICRDTGAIVTATEALLLEEVRSFWRTIATAVGFG